MKRRMIFQIQASEEEDFELGGGGSKILNLPREKEDLELGRRRKGFWIDEVKKAILIRAREE